LTKWSARRLLSSCTNPHRAARPSFRRQVRESA
jgi:hypothetical protein